MRSVTSAASTIVYSGVPSGLVTSETSLIIQTTRPSGWSSRAGAGGVSELAEEPRRAPSSTHALAVVGVDEQLEVERR